MRAFVLEVEGRKPFSGVLPLISVVSPNAQGWTRYQVLHDWQGAGSPNHLDYLVRDVAPDPQVNRLSEFDSLGSHAKVPLNSEMQFYWAGLLSWHKFGLPLASLSLIQREYINGRMEVVTGSAFALTNRSDPYAANYVGGTFLEYDEPKLAALLCGGCTVWGKPAGRNANGREMVEIYSFLSSEPMPEISLTDPRVQWLTAIYDIRNVFPFSHLGDGVGVPYPLITAARYYYDARGLQAYSHEELGRPRYVRNGVPSYL